MIIKVKDEEGLGNALLMDGYTDRQISDAYQSIRTELKDVAVLVFSELKEEILPETIVAHTAHDVIDDSDGTKSLLLASFNSGLSQKGVLVFNVYETTVKRILARDEEEMGKFRHTVIHEMMHAADLPVLLYRNELMESIKKRIDEIGYDDPFGMHPEYPQIALFNLLNMLGHYRAEGIAILGECLMAKQAFADTDKAIHRFRNAFEWTLVNSSKWVSGVKATDRANEKAVWGLAYHSAPVVLLNVLHRRGDIDGYDFVRTMLGMKTGSYPLTDADLKGVLRAALSLGFQEYLLGLVQLGEEVTPLKPLLDFFAHLQDDISESGMDQFIALLGSPDTAELFNAAIGDIMGSLIPEDELDDFYSRFMQDPPDVRAYPTMKETVEKLYSLMKTTSDPVKKHIAQLALTYLFDDQDLIHDDITGLGLVDDMVVLEQALSVL